MGDVSVCGPRCVLRLWGLAPVHTDGDHSTLARRPESNAHVPHVTPTPPPPQLGPSARDRHTRGWDTLMPPVPASPGTGEPRDRTPRGAGRPVVGLGLLRPGMVTRGRKSPAVSRSRSISRRRRACCRRWALSGASPPSAGRSRLQVRLRRPLEGAAGQRPAWPTQVSCPSASWFATGEREGVRRGNLIFQKGSERVPPIVADRKGGARGQACRGHGSERCAAGLGPVEHRRG